MKLAVLAGSAALALSAFAASPVSSGVVRNARGNPVERVTVTIPGAGTAVTAADGTWRIDGVPTGDVLAVAEKAGLFRVRQTVRAEPGKDLRWDVKLGARGVITGRLIDEYDQPLTGRGAGPLDRWRVLALPDPEWMRSWRGIEWGPPPDGGRRYDQYVWRPAAQTDEQGRFTIAADRSILHRLRVTAPGVCSPVLLTGPMSDGLAEIVLRIPASRMPHAHVRLRVAAPDGAPLEKPYVSLLHSEGVASARFEFDAARGAWSSQPVSPGRYSLVVRDPTWGMKDFGSVDVPDAADVDLGELRMSPLGHARLTASGDGPETHLLVLRDDSRWGWRQHAFPTLGGPTRTADVDLSPGRYRVRIWLAPQCEIEQVEVVFEVRPGETTAVTVPFRAAQWRAVRFVFPARTTAYLGATLTDAEGMVVARQFGPGDADVSFRLPPGRYAAVVDTSDERRLTGTLDVPAENAPERFVVVLR